MLIGLIKDAGIRENPISSEQNNEKNIFLFILD